MRRSVMEILSRFFKAICRSSSVVPLQPIVSNCTHLPAVQQHAQRNGGEQTKRGRIELEPSCARFKNLVESTMGDARRGPRRRRESPDTGRIVAGPWPLGGALSTARRRWRRDCRLRAWSQRASFGTEPGGEGVLDGIPAHAR
jgi:hypothetical protein